MSLSAALGWLGLGATILFGVAGVYLVLRRRYPGRLAFLLEKEISLFEDIARNLPELSVTYNGNPVSENLVLVKGVIVNLGDRDVTPEMTHKPLQAALPEAFAWRTARIVETSGDVKATAQIIAPRELVLDLGLFRRDEHLTLEAVAEVPAPRQGSKRSYPNRPLSTALRFHHRIADTAPVEVRELPGPVPTRRKFLAIIFAIYIITVATMPLVSRVFKGEFHYVPAHGSAAEMRASPRLDGVVVLQGIDTGKEEKITLAQFEERDLRHVIRPKELKGYGYLVGGVILLSALFYVNMIIDWRRGKKYRRLFSPVEEDGQSEERVT